MKSSKLLFFILAFLIPVVFTSCKMNSVSLRILVPADINIPQHIKRVGIANRSLPSKENRFLNIAEGFFTGESIFADREGSENCIRGLANQLNNSPRFTAVIIEGEDLRGTGTKEFPLQLDANKIDELCKKYDVDALILLETFDSDIRITQGQRTVEKTTKEGVKYNEIEFFADLGVRVNSGWRIYDNQKKSVIDQNTFTDEKAWNGRGASSQAALNNLPRKRAAINEAGIFSGNMYGRRISPGWINSSRQYYVKGTDDFKQAKRYVKVNNWNGAAEIWKKYVNEPSVKIGGRATYNMALANEVLGDLDAALEWANKAYLNFGLKKARSYVGILQRRIYDKGRLDKQMEEQ